MCRIKRFRQNDSIKSISQNIYKLNILKYISQFYRAPFRAADSVPDQFRASLFLIITFLFVDRFEQFIYYSKALVKWILFLNWIRSLHKESQPFKFKNVLFFMFFGCNSLWSDRIRSIQLGKRIQLTRALEWYINCSKRPKNKKVMAWHGTGPERNRPSPKNIGKFLKKCQNMTKNMTLTFMAKYAKIWFLWHFISLIEYS